MIKALWFKSKVSVSKPTRCSAGLRDPTLLKALGDLRVEIDNT